jgi:hypothetical protein
MRLNPNDPGVRFMQEEGGPVTQPKYRQHTRAERCVPWDQFESYLNQLRQATGSAYNEEVMRAIGYAGAGHLHAWRKLNAAPTLAIYAIKGFLADLKVQAVAPPPVKVREFDVDELAELFALVRLAPDGAARKRLLPKLARAMADVA